MFRFSLALLLSLGAAGSASAATWADALFDEVSRDFGSVPRGPTLTHPFRVVNKTRHPVHIAGVRVSCGCVSARPLQYSLAPGQETAILVQMDTRRFQQTKNVTIYVQFDEPSYDEVRLWVQANSRDDVTVIPDTLSFGRVKQGTAPGTAVNLSFLGSGQWQVTGVTSDSNYVQPSAKVLHRDATEVTYQLTAKLRPDTPAGRWYTDVWVQTNNPASPRVRVPLTVEVESPLAISPGKVSLGQIKAGTHVERKVVVRGVAPFRITGITGTDADLTVRDSTNDKKSVHVLTVTVRPRRPGELSRTIRVHTDLGAQGEISFQTQASVLP
jgi:hypothetical protein